MALLDMVEKFRELVDDLTETQERAKLLQEELAARLAEQTNNNLYILSLFTALLLPPSLVARCQQTKRPARSRERAGPVPTSECYCLARCDLD